MIHNYSRGMGGKGHELHAQSDFDRSWSKGIIEDIYKGFLSQDEMLSVLNGQDIYLNAEQVRTRCDDLIKYREITEIERKRAESEKVVTSNKEVSEAKPD